MKNPNPLIVFYFDSLSLHTLLIKDGFDSQRDLEHPNDNFYFLKINEGDTPNKKYDRLKEFFLFVIKLQTVLRELEELGCDIKTVELGQIVLNKKTGIQTLELRKNFAHCIENYLSL